MYKMPKMQQNATAMSMDVGAIMCLGSVRGGTCREQPLPDFSPRHSSPLSGWGTTFFQLGNNSGWNRFCCPQVISGGLCSLAQVLQEQSG